jgi:hypothetical protein
LNVFLIFFIKKLGFKKGRIGYLFKKDLDGLQMLFFTLLGGIMAKGAGTIKTMFFAGRVLMALTNLLFAILAWTGKSELLFAIAVVADDIYCSLLQQ